MDRASYGGPGAIGAMALRHPIEKCSQPSMVPTIDQNHLNYNNPETADHSEIVDNTPMVTTANRRRVNILRSCR
jgi:hypothetical protein